MKRPRATYKGAETGAEGMVSWASRQNLFVADGAKMRWELVPASRWGRHATANETPPGK